MDKNQRKLIEKEIREEVDSLDERLIKLNQIMNILEPLGGLNNIEPIDMHKYFTSDARWMDIMEPYYRDDVIYNKYFIGKLKNLIYADKLYTAGCLLKFSDLLDAIEEYTIYSISPLSNQLRYQQIKAIDEDALLGNITLTALKLMIYSICDNLTDTWGREITEYCTNNDNNVIKELVEEEYQTKSKINTQSVAEHMSMQELSLLRQKIRTGEKFFIYRGFAIKETDKVRRGMKTDGDLYYLQDSGTGLSYTLDESVAVFFAHRSICSSHSSVRSRYYIPTKTWYVPNDKYMEALGNEIMQLREEKELKPIIGKYECDPSKITGYYFGSNEAEIIIKPEDLKILSYDIPHSATLAADYCDWLNRTTLIPNMLSYGAFWNGLTACCTYNAISNQSGYIFAETEMVREELELAIDDGKEMTDRTGRRLISAFCEHSVIIPENISPFTFGDGLLEYMKNPTSIKRKKENIYWKRKD